MNRMITLSNAGDKERENQQTLIGGCKLNVVNASLLVHFTLMSANFQYVLFESHLSFSAALIILYKKYYNLF